LSATPSSWDWHSGAAGVSAQLRTPGGNEEVEAEWVLGCDGAHSMVREQAGIAFSGASYPELFVLADIRIGGELDPAEAYVWRHRDGGPMIAKLTHCWSMLPSDRCLKPVEGQSSCTF
jgi:2-polyprenyl-6-methoxyphenol hydroxylase-like FAD-dependent oxidoreductase